jgi:hypothetical protein
MKKKKKRRCFVARVFDAANWTCEVCGAGANKIVGTPAMAVCANCKEDFLAARAHGMDVVQYQSARGKSVGWAPGK